jgi:hypothetical protein
MAVPPLGDDRKKGGENVWISRRAIDLALREAHPVFSSETKARRTSSEHRKVGAREAQREAARPTGGKPRERCKAGSRDGNEPRKGDVTGVGWRIRTAMVRGVSRRLPWSRRGRLGRGLSDTTPARRQRDIADVAPRSTGGFGRTVTRGCVASGPGSGLSDPAALVQGAPEAGRTLARRNLAVQLRLHQGEVPGVRHADAAPGCGKHGEGVGVERPSDDLGQQDL